MQLSTEAMATRFELVMHGLDPRRLRAAGEEALAEIERLDRQLSAYSPQSDISRINAHAASGPVKVEPWLFDLLQQACDLHRLTDGAFDITIGPLMRAWGFARGEGAVPSDNDLTAARALVGADKIVLDDSNSTIRFLPPPVGGGSGRGSVDGMRIDLGAIGKGYAIEQAIELLQHNGITSALLHGGASSIHAIGSPPDQDAWRVAIHDGATIDLHNSSLSVSAVHGRSFTEDGINYGHVIDPRTGLPVHDTLQAAVIGPSATVCDALSTALLVLGQDWLGELEKRFVGYRGVVTPSEPGIK